MAPVPARALRSFLPRWAPACLLVLAACTTDVELPDDAAACAGLRCSAGQCFSNAGQPQCRCGDWEKVAKTPCEVGGVGEPDDPGGSPESAAVLTLPMEAANGLIENPDRSGMEDRDLYVFTTGTTGARHVYTVSCVKQTLGTCLLRLLAADGQEVTRKLNEDLHATLEAGTWYVEVSGDKSWGRYAYHVLDRGEDDHGDTTATATRLVPPAERLTVTHTLSEEWDVFTFRSRPYHGYRFICEKASHEWELRLTSQAGAEIDAVPNRVLATPATLSLVAAQESDWFVRMRVGKTSFPATSACRLLDLGPDEHADGLEGATPLTPGVPVRVALQSSQDVDVLSFSAQAGHVYAVRAEGQAPYTAEVLTASGRVLKTGSVGELGFKPEAPGTYYVRIKEGVAWQPTTLAGVVDLGPDDHGDGLMDATPLAQDTTVTGRFQSAHDIDAFTFGTLAAGIYTVTCAPGCELTFFEEAGLRHAPVGAGRQVFSTGLSAPVTLYARGLDTFSLRVEEVATDDHGDGFPDTTRLSLPASVSGVVQTAVDVDAFSVPLEAGRTYRLVLASGSLEVVLTGPGGFIVNPQAGLFTATVTGDYFLTLSRAAGLESVPWSFTLRPE